MSNQKRHQAGAPESRGGKFAPHVRASDTSALETPKHPSNGLTVPEDWDGEYPLTAASQWVGDRMTGGDTVANPDPVCARCDYAEVSEEGIAYGYNIGPNLIGEIAVGPPLDGESESDYAERVNDALTSEDLTAIDQFFLSEYNAGRTDCGDYGDIALEFYVPYGPEGLEGTSVEQMGDRAESETKLLRARDDWEYGGAMQHKLATALGYRAERSGQDAYAAIQYVKNELVPA